MDTVQRRQQRAQNSVSRVSQNLIVRVGEVIQRDCCEMFNSEYTMSSTVRPLTLCSAIYISAQTFTMLLPSFIILVRVRLRSQITKSHTKSYDRLPSFTFLLNLSSDSHHSSWYARPTSLYFPVLIHQFNCIKTIESRRLKQLQMQLRHGQWVRKLHSVRQREMQIELVPLGMCAGDRGARRDMVVPELQSQRSVLH